MSTYSNTAIRWSATFVCCLLALSAVILAARVWPHDDFLGILTLTLVVVAVAFFRAGYLTCSRWSPLAIRHLVGALFFLITIGLITVVKDPKRCLGILVVCYAIYRIVAFQLARHVFPHAISDVRKS